MNMYRTIPAIIGAGAIAAVVTVLTGTSELVSASAPEQPAHKINCSAQAWPNYDAACIRDTRTSDGLARTVRIIDPNRAVR